MSRRTRMIAGPLAATALLLLLVFFFARSDTATAAPGDPPAFPVATEVPVPLAAVDTPPVAQAGWPFRELPMVLKIEGPRPRLATGPLPPMRTVGPLAPPLRQFPPAPPETGSPVPAGLIAPLALGAALGGTVAGATITDRPPEPPTPQVVPEPGTTLLVLTGLIGVLAAASRRTG